MILLFHFIFLITKYTVITLSKSMSSKKDVHGNETNTTNLNNETSINFVDYTNVKSESKYINGNLKFFPPVYVQRYEMVTLILKQHSRKDSLKKVVDFGCSEMNFFLYLKNIPNVEEILEVDINDVILDQYCSKVLPLNSDYLFTKRMTPLEVYVLAGNIAEYDDFLIDTDVVIAIEVIEHLEPDILKKMPYNIFHEIKPKLAIFTTPNADFNVLFLNKQGFRHADHKFEWNRKEFYNWTRDIIKDYPNYSVKFYGIGTGPEGTENLGCCTQMAVFEKLSELEDNNLILKGIKNYKLIRKVEHPYFVDIRSNEEKIVDEVYYRIKFSFNILRYFNCDEHIAEIPLTEFMEFVDKWCESVEQLRQILMDNGLNVKERNGEHILLYVITTPESSVRSETDASEETSISHELLDEKLEFEDWSLEYVNEIVTDSCSNKTTEELSNSSSATNLEELNSEVMLSVGSKSSLLSRESNDKESKDFGNWERNGRDAVSEIEGNSSPVLSEESETNRAPEKNAVLSALKIIGGEKNCSKTSKSLINHVW